MVRVVRHTVGWGPLMRVEASEMMVEVVVTQVLLWVVVMLSLVAQAPDRVHMVLHDNVVLRQ